MIYGIGVDLIRIERIRKAAEKWGERFLKKVYTGEEISYCFSKRNPYLSLAVRFAAKEALIKAIGSGIPVSLKDIEVFNFGSGKPSIKINGELKEFFDKMEIKRIHLSLSHEKDYGAACVVLEG